MASKKKTTVPSRTQAKVRTLQSFRNESPEQLRRREQVNFPVLDEGLDVIHGISQALDYVSEMCQGNGQVNMLPTIAAGLGEVLKVVHRRLTAEIEVRP